MLPIGAAGMVDIAKPQTSNILIFYTVYLEVCGLVHIALKSTVSELNSRNRFSDFAKDSLTTCIYLGCRSLNAVNILKLSSNIRVADIGPCRPAN